MVEWVTTYVEARDDAVEGCCAVGVRRPHAAQPGAVVGYEGLGLNSQSYHFGWLHCFLDLRLDIH